MDRFDFYFNQKVTEEEIDGAFLATETALNNFLLDFQYTGIARNAQVVEHSPQNFTVDVQGPAAIYDQNGNRAGFVSTQNVSLLTDESGASTAVASSGNEKYLSVFIEHVRLNTDPRTDGFNNTVYFKNADSYNINVVQGAEATAGSAVRPSLRPDQILLADVLIEHNETVIDNSNIDTTRTQNAFVLTGSPLSVSSSSLGDVLQAMVDEINTFTTTNASLGATQTFTGTNTFTQQLVLDETDQEEPRVESTLTISSYLLLSRWRTTSSPAIYLRLYAASGTGGLHITYNAERSSGVWVPDYGQADAVLYTIGEDGEFNVQRREQPIGASFTTFNVKGIVVSSVDSNFGITFPNDGPSTSPHITYEARNTDGPGTDITITGQDGQGTNNVGGDIILAGGAGDGTGTSGEIKFRNNSNNHDILKVFGQLEGVNYPGGLEFPAQSGMTSLPSTGASGAVRFFMDANTGNVLALDSNGVVKGLY